MPMRADLSNIGVDERTRRNRSKTNGAPQTRRWWLEPEEKLHLAAWGVADTIYENMRARRREWFVYAKMYNNVDLVGMHAVEGLGFERMARPGDITLNVVQNAIDTASSMIAKNRPKPMFLTDGADWKTLQKAMKLTKYTAACIDDAGIDAIAERVFTSGGVYGTGAIKIYADEEKKRVCAEHVLLNELLVDDLEGLRERPSQIHQRKLVNRDTLAEQFSEYREQIMSDTLDEDRVGRTTADVVLVLESWHLKSGPNAKDGLHTITIRNCTLLCEEYDKDYYPILFWRWYPSTHGFWGRGICDQIGRLQREINRLLQTIQQAQSLVGVPVWLVPKGSGVDWNHLGVNEIGREVAHNPNLPPTCVTPPPMHEQVYQHLWQLVQNAFNIVGINQSMAQGQKQPGLESGAAIREATDIASGRFQVVGQRWEAFYIDMARVVVDLSKDLYAASGEDIAMQVESETGDALDTVKWSEVDMDADRYKIRVFPISGLPSTPSGRIQQVMEWVAAGWLPKEQAMELLDFPDLKRFRDLETGTIVNVQGTIAKIKESGKFDLEQAPIPQLNLGLAMAVATRECVVAKNQGVDDDTLAELQRYLRALDEEMKRQQPAPLPPPPPGAPPGMPGMPPGPPPGGPPAPGTFQPLAA